MTRRRSTRTRLVRENDAREQSLFRALQEGSKDAVPKQGLLDGLARSAA